MHIQPKLEEDLVLVKDHTAKPFQPRFKGNFRVVTQKGNQVEIRPAKGGETTKFHVTNIKKIILADQVISQLPDYNNLGRLTKLRLNPKDISNLDWQLASELNTVPSLYHTMEIGNEIISTDQVTSKMVMEITTRQNKTKQIKGLEPFIYQHNYNYKKISKLTMDEFKCN